MDNFKVLAFHLCFNGWLEFFFTKFYLKNIGLAELNNQFWTSRLLCVSKLTLCMENGVDKHSKSVIES